MGAITRTAANNFTTGGVILPAAINDTSVASLTELENVAAGGAMTLISEQTASASASIEFTTGIDSTYPIYKFVWINCHPSQQVGDGEEFQFNLSTDTGSNYNVTKTSTYFIATHAESDSSTSFSYTDGHDLAQSTSAQRVAVDMDADDDASTSGSMFLFNPSSTTFVKHYMVANNYMHSSPLTINSYIAGYGNTTSAIDAVKFEFSATTIQSGTIKLYGISGS